MSDETVASRETPDDVGNDQELTGVVSAEVDPHGATIVASVEDESGVQAVGMIETDYFNALIVAEFADPSAAERAYLALRDAELGGRLKVDGVLAVSSDGDGKIHVVQMTDHSTKTGLKWGVVGGLVLGILFPPSLLASSIAVGTVGSVLGKLRNVHHKSQIAEQLDGAIGPNHSGIIAVIHKGALAVAEQSLPEATNITVADVDEATAREITEAAREAG